MQDLSKFKMPRYFRGKPALFVQLWWLVQATLFKCSPQIMYRFRASLLRAFGAQIGKNVIVRPSATFTYPWKVSLGDNCWIGDDVVIYSLGSIKIGSNTVISQKSYLCAGDHDPAQEDFPIRSKNIEIGSECWLAADCFVAPGVSIGNQCVVGARSSVFRSLPSGMICTGSPCRPVRQRVSYSLVSSQNKPPLNEPQHK